MEHIKCLIIGSGPAGYTAAIYAARAGLQPVVIAGPQSGGQLIQTTVIDNFPGYPEGVNGFDMMEDLRRQAERFGTEVRYSVVTAVDFATGGPHRLTIDGETQLEADAVIIATGASAAWLGLPSEEQFKGRGVSACATCDGFFYRKKTVAVVGGGDTACEEASYLAGLCTKVYLIVRRDVLRASQAMQDRIKAIPNIEILFGYQTRELTGEGRLQHALLVHRDGGEKTIDIDGFFLAIGHHPNTELFKDYVKTDAQGYIVTLPDSTETGVPGVFACGDVQDSRFRQAIVAAGSGCRAALEAERYLKQL